MQGLGSRIKEAADRVGGLDGLAEKLSLTKRRTLSDYVSEKSEPKLSALEEIALVTGVYAEWLAFGHDGLSQQPENQSIADITLAVGSGQRRRALDAEMGVARRPLVSQWQSQSILSNDLIRIPRFDIHASAGVGLPVGPEVQLAAVAFDPAFLRERGAVPDQCSIITASGDSMQPSIPDGSLLVVDHSQTDVRNGHIMVINVGEDLLVKRIRRRLDGLIDLISDNPAYPPETIGRDTIEQLRVVGRVVYFCRTP
jgi:transcriptional regulator with XRE-family HTH domain